MKRLLACAAAVALSASGTVIGATIASAHSQDTGTWVSVMGDGSRVTTSRSAVDEGIARFRVSSTNTGGGSDITLFQPKANVSVGTVLADLQEEFASDPATNAKGTRDLTRDARFFGRGRAARQPGHRHGASEERDLLPDGPGRPPSEAPVITTMHVRGNEGGDDGRLPSASATVDLTSADTFVTHGRMPANGTVRVRNVWDTIHFMAMSPVKAGTTDADIQAYLDAWRRGRQHSRSTVPRSASTCSRPDARHG